MTTWSGGLDIDGAIARLVAAGEDGLDEATGDVFEESQAFVPELTGELRASGRVVGDGMRRSIVYDAEHASIVHEDLTAAHDDGRAKYLETPLNGARRTAGPTIARRVRRETS